MVFESDYKPHFLFKNGHVNTVYRTLFQKVIVHFKRFRMELPDGDFMDLDFSQVGSDIMAVIVHGLEGSSESTYVKALCHRLNQDQIDVCCVNLRGCSGEDNRLFSSYHSGRTEDLKAVLSYIKRQFNYNKTIAIGYSLGGNMVLKFVGEQGANASHWLNKAVAVSVPCDLKGAAYHIGKPSNFVYMYRFLRTLKQKATLKLNQFPDCGLSFEQINQVKNFLDYDNLYTAPAHGFKDADDYWKNCSAKQFIKGIKIPTLMINSKDDPFLPPSCIPLKEAQNHNYFNLELSKYGGHVGFNKHYSSPTNQWLEARISRFVTQEN